jgi:hypothetical protein
VQARACRDRRRRDRNTLLALDPSLVILPSRPRLGQPKTGRLGPGTNKTNEEAK